jgi:hypothetical protein
MQCEIIGGGAFPPLEEHQVHIHQPTSPISHINHLLENLFRANALPKHDFCLINNQLRILSK